jgi:hypothetical protein
MNATAISSLLQEESRIETLVSQVRRLDKYGARRILAAVVGLVGRLEEEPPSTTITAATTPLSLDAILGGHDDRMWERCQTCVLAHPGGITTDGVASALEITRQRAYNSLYVTERRQKTIRHTGQIWYPRAANKAAVG